MANDINPWFDYGNAAHMPDNSLAEAYGLFVVLGEDDIFRVNTSAGTVSFGTMVNQPTRGFVPSVRFGSTAYVIVGEGGINVGDSVTNDAQGRTVVAADGDVIMGVCIEAADEDQEGRINIIRPAAAQPTPAAGE